MKKSDTVKALPKGEISIQIGFFQDKDLFLLVTCDGKDEDGNWWNIGYAKCFRLCLRDSEIDKVSRHNEMNTLSDAKTTLLSFRKHMKKMLPSEFLEILYIDVLFVSPLFRRIGIGKMIMSEILKFVKAEGFQGIVLKAHPFVTLQSSITNQQSNKQTIEDPGVKFDFAYIFGDIMKVTLCDNIKQQSNKHIRKNTAELQEFYSNLGFMKITKTSDVMFLITDNGVASAYSYRLNRKLLDG